MAEISRKFINMYLIFPKNLILKNGRNISKVYKYVFNFSKKFNFEIQSKLADWLNFDKIWKI